MSPFLLSTQSIVFRYLLEVKVRVLSQDFDYKAQKGFNFCFTSDWHLEAAAHNRRKLKQDLDHAKKTDCRVYVNGDIFDLILPGDMKRYVKANDLSKGQAVINETIQNAFEFIEPYIDIIDGIGVGNHESSTVKYHSVDPVAWLIQRMNEKRDKALPPIHHMGYSGYLIMNFHHGEHRSIRRLKIWYHHGVGGSSPVTKGMIDINRAVYSNEADLYWMGHKHTAAIDPGIERLYLDSKNQPYVKTLKAFYTAGYHGGMIHEQVRGTEYVPDFSTERFLSRSSSGSVFMSVHLCSAHTGTGYAIETSLTTGQS